MIKVILPKNVEKRLERELKTAGKKEIGGILMGEYIEENTFKIHEITVDNNNGTWNGFVRVISEKVRISLQKFHQRTNHVYERYNYLGEWHSHPSFMLKPSSQDVQSMWGIVNDRSVGANFSVLLIVKLKKRNVSGKIYLFMPGSQISEGYLIREDGLT